jgi:hypothetical protein
MRLFVFAAVELADACSMLAASALSTPTLTNNASAMQIDMKMLIVVLIM